MSADSQQRRVLMVMDLDMKRVDMLTDFTQAFLRAGEQRGIEVEYLLPKEPDEIVRERLRSVPFRWRVASNWLSDEPVTPRKRRNFRVALTIARTIREGRFSVVGYHFCSIWTAALVTVLTTLRGCRPRSLWYQRLEVRTESSSAWVRWLAQYVSTARLFAFVDAICAVSIAVQRQLIEKRVPPSKIRVIYNGIEISRYATGPVKRIEDLLPGAPPLAAPVITAVSNLIPAKGVQHLIEAVRAVVAQAPHALFVIVGEGPYERSLRTLARKLGVEANVYFTGKRSDVPDILRASTLLVQPSLKESLSNVTIEAMGAGKAVVASRVGGLPELVDDGSTGFLVAAGEASPMAEAILRVIADPERAAEMGRRGQQKILRSFTLDKAVEAHVAFLERHLPPVSQPTSAPAGVPFKP